MRLPGVSTVLDHEGRRFTEVFEPDHRRVWVPVAEIPEVVQKAFIAAETSASTSTGASTSAA
jgi:membrane peptidoglycan carboxypeptidase